RLGHRIFNSETLRKQLAEIANSLKIDNAEKKRMIRAVLTRWNTVFDVLDRGLDIQPAIDRLCATSTGRASIKRLLLSNEEWQVLYQLHGVLKPFKDATLRLSTNKHPRIFEVIPLIDLLNQHLEGVATQRQMSPIVRMAAAAGIGILDKYYSKTDESIMY
ncbi:hypothetical protein C8F01DRAFT_1348087, partial [Mycena amicta]